MNRRFGFLFLCSSLALAGTEPAPSCPNLSGSFASEQDQAYGIVWTWTQTGCEKINQASNYSEGMDILTDGVRRQPCPTCSWVTMGFTPTSLDALVEDVTSDHCNERHSYKLNADSNVVDDWAYLCPDGHESPFQTIYYRKRVF